MIVTLTPNPAVDRTLDVAVVRRGEVLRATGAQLDAGGKGVNVARALIANGLDALAVLPLGGGDGYVLSSLLVTAGIPHRAISTVAPTRSNVTLAEPDGTVTKANAPGFPLTAQETATLLDVTIEALAGATWLVGCGSLPDGAPSDLYATLTRRGHDAGVRVAIDSSGTPLRRAIDAGPDLIKPNLAELAELVGWSLPTIDHVIDAAEWVRARGVATVLVSLGARGAVLVDGSEPTLAVPPVVVPRSDVGAGDTLLAGFLATDGSATERLRQAVAWAAAAVALPGTQVPGPDDIDASGVELRPATERDPLTEPIG